MLLGNLKESAVGANRAATFVSPATWQIDNNIIAVISENKVLLKSFTNDLTLSRLVCFDRYIAEIAFLDFCH